MFGTTIDIGALRAPPSLAGDTFATEKHVGIRDASELEAIVGRVLRPHKLKVERSNGPLDAALFLLKGQSISLLVHQYGESVFIEPRGVGQFLLVDMPLAGNARYQVGREEFTGSAQHAVILPSDRPLRVNFEKGLQQIIVRIEWNLVQTACQRYFGMSDIDGLSFRPELDLTTPAGNAWRAAVHNLLAFSQSSEAFPRADHYASQIADLMINALLIAHPNSLSKQLGDVGRASETVMPRYVKLAVDYLHAHASEPLTIAGVAKEVGVSPSALSVRFRETLHQTPGDYLRRIRLERVRAELIGSDSSERSITDVALEWGFSHYGHFARNYFERYGEHPRETLRRARSSKPRAG